MKCCFMYTFYVTFCGLRVNYDLHMCHRKETNDVLPFTDKCSALFKRTTNIDHVSLILNTHEKFL